MDRTEQCEEAGRRDVRAWPLLGIAAAIGLAGLATAPAAQADVGIGIYLGPPGYYSYGPYQDYYYNYYYGPYYGPYYSNPYYYDPYVRRYYYWRYNPHRPYRYHRPHPYPHRR